MKQTTAPHKTPSPNGGDKKPVTAEGPDRNSQNGFLVAALNMSWQLAIVVLVPIIGGFELDSKLGSSPALTIVGFVVAMAGAGVVVWRQLQVFTAPPKTRRGRAL